MVFKLAQSAEKGWRKLNGCALAREVSQGAAFVDGIRKAACGSILFFPHPNPAAI
jgi:hypothetical protein